ncbi:MAG: hypothetical protein NXI23_05115 [Bacteroidetes bacterium]|nr:hypothetical protein [Bacteroidota bacterium]
MTFLVKNICFSILLIMLPAFVNGQYALRGGDQKEALPKVFVLGSHEDVYEKTISEYNQLLAVCDNDLKVAFEKWISMMLEMEAYAKQITYDLRGVKVWIHVFWDSKGSIDHIGYHLKPNSRNVDTKELNAFFTSFVGEYQFPLLTDSRYSHYTTVSFPVFAKRINKSTSGKEPDD